jgi:hypothetical protein
MVVRYTPVKSAYSHRHAVENRGEGEVSSGASDGLAWMKPRGGSATRSSPKWLYPTL